MPGTVPRDEEQGGHRSSPQGEHGVRKNHFYAQTFSKELWDSSLGEPRRATHNPNPS